MKKFTNIMGNTTKIIYINVLINKILTMLRLKFRSVSVVACVPPKLFLAVLAVVNCDHVRTFSSELSFRNPKMMQECKNSK